METGKTKQNKKKNHQGSSRQIRKETSPIFGEEMLHLAG